MIKEKTIKDKLKPLNDRIVEVYSIYGKSLGEQLINRISISLDQLFNDFKNLSSQSFDLYWNRIQQLNSDLSSKKIEKENLKKENVPKFISKFNKKNKE